MYTTEYGLAGREGANAPRTVTISTSDFTAKRSRLKIEDLFRRGHTSITKVTVRCDQGRRFVSDPYIMMEYINEYLKQLPNLRDLEVQDPADARLLDAVRAREDLATISAQPAYCSL